jgi:hypothetical protein
MAVKPLQQDWVLRVEKNNHHLGPYGHCPDWEDEFHCGATGRPSPSNDFGLFWERDEIGGYDRSRYRFGFSSVDQLKQWFTVSELERLHERGWIVKCIRIKQGYATDRQVIFIRDEGEDELPISLWELWS